MIEDIKKFRVKIDGLSQLVKELKSFEITTTKLDLSKTGDTKDGYYGMIESIPKTFSHTYQKNEYHHLVRTDRGTFRWTTPDNNLAIYEIDLKSKEVNECYKSLILAKAWLDKMLGELGSETPYTNDGSRKEVKDIESPADVNSYYLEDFRIKYTNTTSNYSKNWQERNYIEKIDYLRQEIQQLNNNIGVNRDVPFKQWMMCEEYSNKYLSEARFWLGFELQRIKETSI